MLVAPADDDPALAAPPRVDLAVARRLDGEEVAVIVALEVAGELVGDAFEDRDPRARGVELAGDGAAGDLGWGLFTLHLGPFRLLRSVIGGFMPSSGWTCAGHRSIQASVHVISCQPSTSAMRTAVREASRSLLPTTATTAAQPGRSQWSSQRTLTQRPWRSW